MNSTNTFFFILLSVLASVFIYLYNINVNYIPWGMPTPFADLITITHSVDCSRNGFDPYTYVAFDPWERRYNYPKLWLTLFDFFNFDKNQTVKIGFSIISLYVISVFFVFKKLELKNKIFSLIFIVSPPALLALERGNSDLFIFFITILGLGIVYLNKEKFNFNSILCNICLLILIMFATLLKVYAIFLFPLFLFINTNQKQTLVFLIIIFLFLTSFIYFNYSDLIFVSKNTPRPSELAYGKNIWFQEFLSPKQMWIHTLFVSTIVFLLPIYFIKKNKNWLSHYLNIEKKHYLLTLLFLSGGFIFIGTFLIGNNYEYRLIFLILILPLLFTLKTKTTYFILIILFVIFYSSFLHLIILEYENYHEWFIYRNSIMIIKWISTLILCVYITTISYLILLNKYKTLYLFNSQNERKLN